MIHKMTMVADKVIDIDAPGTGRIPRTLIRPYNELQPESKRAFERGFEELKHRTNMKTGGITASDKRDFGLDLRFTHRKEHFLDDQSNVQLEVLEVFIDYTVQMALDEMPSTGKYRKPSSAGPTCIAIPGVWMPETIAAGEGAPEDVFDEEKARRDATNNFALAWLNWQKLAASIDWRQQECTKNAPVWATLDVEAVFKNDLGIPQYPPHVLLQLDVLPFYELIIKSPAATLQQYGHLPHVAVSFLGRHASNAASEGCHSVAKLVMSDKQMAMSPSIFSKFVMLRHSKLAIAALKEMYKDEAQHVAHDITALEVVCDSTGACSRCRLRVIGR